MFSQIKKIFSNDSPSFRAGSLGEAVESSLDYAMYMLGDNPEGVFVPAVLSFAQSSEEVHIERFVADEQEDGSWDMGLSTAQALDFFENNAGADWDAVCYAGLVTAEGATEKQDAVVGQVRDNREGVVANFMRTFGYDGRLNQWSSSTEYLP